MDQGPKSAAPLVEASGVTKRFGRLAAVDNLSIEITGGQFVTLLGPSGCGKTTLLRMIGGLEQPDAGSIRVAGRPIESYQGPARPTRMVFQSYALFPHMTVAENVAYGLKLGGASREDVRRRVTEQLATVGLSEKAGAYPSELSGGQQQRVALARALATKPQLLLLDEPLAALDLKLRQRMQSELKDLQRAAGITFVYVTHDQHEALALSDEIVVMRTGRIVQRGAPSEIYARPSSRYVANFVGEATVITGTVDSMREGQTVVATSLGLFTVATRVPFPIGAGLDLVIRPEHVHLDVGGGPNAVAGTIVETTYRGMDAIAELAIRDARLRFIVPSHELGAVRAGQQVSVNIPPEAMWPMALETPPGEPV